MKKRTLIIDRKHWIRGGSDGKGNIDVVGELYREGQMCCLGFECRANGIGIKSIKNLSLPADICYKNPELLIKKIPHLVTGGYDDTNLASTDFVSSATNINDSQSMTSKAREKKLTKLFATENIKLKFIN